MNTPLSPIAATARLEAATEALAEYIGYLNREIDIEQDLAEPNAGRIEALEHELEIVWGERRAITPDNLLLINRALYVRAPFLKLTALHAAYADWLAAEIQESIDAPLPNLAHAEVMAKMDVKISSISTKRK